MMTVTCQYFHCGTEIFVDGKKLYTTAATDDTEAKNIRKLVQALGISAGVRIRRIDTTTTKRRRR